MLCSYNADYSTVTGDRILPFQFTLNQEKSILFPKEGENQTWCYEVEGTGEDLPLFSDLSHFLLGICKDITQEDILDITVTVDGIPQEVIWGENVEIRTEEAPDPTTGCIGLKFNFGLNKTDGKMEACITLASPYAVGPVSVCVFGRNVTASGLSICGPVCETEPSCENTFFQKTQVCVPVTVTPFATPGEATVTCCGQPVVVSRNACPGTDTSCTFTVTQELCIQIPISFGADVRTGTAKVQCGAVSETPCECGTAQPEPEKAKNVSNDVNGIRSFIHRR